MKLADKRYTIAREFCGYPTKRWVARFCGEWIGQGSHKSDAIMHIVAHRDERQAMLSGAVAAAWSNA